MYHETFCRRNGKCACSIRRVTNRNGKPVSIKSPASFRVNFGGTSQELPDAVLYLPKVSKAIKSGWLELIEEQPVVKARKAIVTPAPVETPKARKKTGDDMQGGN